jgi:aryl-alcohol dehydrogenase-like predicted oxidoreductase
VDRERAKNVLKALRSVSAAMGISVSRIALAWLLTRPFVTSVIIGAKTKEQLADNLAASETQLSAEHVAQLETASALPAEYPGWMVERQDRDRRPHAETKSEVKKAA